MLRIVVAIVIVGAAPLAGCEREAGKSRTEERDTRAISDVVARVGGRSIGAAEVEARMVAEGLSAKAALEQLIDEELLLQEAERLGFTEDREGERTIERLMVRAMLHDIEKKNTPESISEEEVREDFALHADKFQVLERRDSWHILVREPSDEGRVLAESILREVRQADDPKIVYQRYAEGAADDPELQVQAEELPPITMKAGIEKPYKDALFGAKSKGPLKEVVKTSYGWHTIVVTDILPGERRTVEDVEDQIRERLSQKRRFGMLVEIVESLEAQGLVQYEDQAVERMLSASGLPERAE